MIHPIPLTLLICDHAWRDPNSGKYSLLGIFSGYASLKFPFEIDMTAYFAVTDGQGILPIRMELIDIDEDRPAVFDATAEFRFDDNFMNFVNVIRLRAAIESLSFAGI